MKIHKRGQELVIPQIYDSSIKYRMNKYVITYKDNDDVILYNALNNFIVSYKESEFNNELQNLVKMYFYVPVDFNEEYIADNIRMLYTPLNVEPFDKINRYTILTTTDCNAKCFYCFQKDKKHIDMPIKVAQDLAKYIVDHYNGKQVELHWFGGEPLYNEPIIDEICTILHDNAINYFSSMISNSYLFDESKAEKYINLWRLKTVQVTIDGINEEYNNVKQIAEDGFERVVENTKMLLRNKIKASVRLNLSLTNKDKLKDVIYYFDKNVEKSKYFSIYATELYEFCFKNNIEPEKLEQLYKDLEELSGLIAELYGTNQTKRIPSNFRNFGCSAINGNELVVVPSGKFNVCEHHIEDDFIGGLYDKNFDLSMISKYRQRVQKIEGLCNDCPIYPICYKTVGCGMGDYCTTFKREHTVHTYRNTIKNILNNSKKPLYKCNCSK
jgi:radical SAM protein with 4Fe4S-binding SPASM domain